jgi:hypothetical protein
VLQAAILYDTIEDTQTTPQELDEQFGQQVRSLVFPGWVPLPVEPSPAAWTGGDSVTSRFLWSDQWSGEKVVMMAQKEMSKKSAKAVPWVIISILSYAGSFFATPRMFKKASPICNKMRA